LMATTHVFAFQSRVGPQRVHKPLDLRVLHPYPEFALPSPPFIRAKSLRAKSLMPYAVGMCAPQYRATESIRRRGHSCLGL